MKFQHGQRLDTFDALEELGPGDRVTIAGKPATVFDVVEGDEIYIVYVLDGKKTKKELSMFDAVLPSETEEDGEDYDDFYYEDGEPQSEFVDEKPEVEVRYIAPGKDLFDEPGLRKSPGRRNRPMTSLVPPVAEGKTMKITKRQLRRIIREEKARLSEISPTGIHGTNLADDEAYENEYMAAMQDLYEALEIALQKAKQAGLEYTDVQTAWDDAREGTRY